jgi:hypothetical protein
MPFSEFEIKRYEKILNGFIDKNRPPIEVRNQVDLHFKIENYSVLIYETRPKWNDSTKILEIPIAKATYVNKSKIWKIYWQGSSLKWQGYEPQATVNALEDFLEVVSEDKYGCFWG